MNSECFSCQSFVMTKFVVLIAEFSTLFDTCQFYTVIKLFRITFTAELGYIESVSRVVKITPLVMTCILSRNIPHTCVIFSRPALIS